MIYDFTLLSGWEFSGVDVAQGFRAQVFEKNHIPSKFIFTTLPTKRDIELYTGQGILTKQMLVSQLYIAGCDHLETTMTVDEILMQEKAILNYDEAVSIADKIQLKRNGVLLAEIETNQCGYFLIVNYYVKNKVYMKNYYLDRLVCTEVIEENRKKRIYFDGNGRVALEEVIDNGETYYLFPNGDKADTFGFMELFVQNLNLTENDICILDRAGYMEFTSALFRYKEQARIIAVLHSKQYFENHENIGSLYMNYEYYYWFKYAEQIDAFVVGTNEQKIDLEEELRRNNCDIPTIVSIPPGAIRQKIYPKQMRKQGSMITASRIGAGKGLDLLIKSVAKSHERNSTISLDVYGTGTEKDINDLRALIQDLNADSYIRLMGRHKLDEVYIQYEAYITCSFCEAFGLSLMEAVGSGLAMIGLDAKYGNRLFIHPNENGYLVDFDVNQDIESPNELIDHVADRIVELFEDEQRLESFHKKSYELANQYNDACVTDKWIKFC